MSSATPAAIATLSPSTGTTRTVRFCVSFARSALPAIATLAAGPTIARLSVLAIPWVIFAEPLIESNANPSLKTSPKSSDIRRGSDCSESTPSSLPTPGFTFTNCPFSALTSRFPVSVP